MFICVRKLLVLVSILLAILLLAACAKVYRVPMPDGSIEKMTEDEYRAYQKSWMESERMKQQAWSDEFGELDPDEAHFGFEFPPPPPTSFLDAEKVEYFLLTEPPYLLGGVETLSAYIAANNLYPEQARLEQVEGDVIVDFVVDTQGVPSDATARHVRPEGYGFGEAAVVAILAMRFTPGYYEDQVVNTHMQQPIRFRLQ